MNLNKPITLFVLYDDKEDKKLIDMGVDVDSKPILKRVVFYSVDTLSSLDFDGEQKSRACLSSGGTDYVCELTMDEVEMIINSSLDEK